MMYNFYSTGKGTFNFECINENDYLVAVYRLVDYSTEQGTMFLVQRAENPAIQMWTENFIEAQNLCKRDCTNRGL